MAGLDATASWHRRVIEEPDFRTGRLSIGYADEHLGLNETKIVVGARRARRGRPRGCLGRAPCARVRGRRLMRYAVTIGDQTVEVELGPDSVRVDDRALAAELTAVPDSPVRSLLLGTASHWVVAYARGRGRWDLRLGGWHLTTEVLDERTRAIRALTGAATVSAGARPVRTPMPGLVVRVEVEEGDQVRPG